MSKLKLKNGTSFELAKNGIDERKDYIKYVFVIPENATLEEMEKFFLSDENTEIVYITDDEGEITRTITGYTKYKSLEKTKTTVAIKMGLPDWKEKYDELKAIVDQMVARGNAYE